MSQERDLERKLRSRENRAGWLASAEKVRKEIERLANESVK